MQLTNRHALLMLMGLVVGMGLSVVQLAAAPNSALAAAPLDLCADGSKHFTKWYFGDKAALDFDTISGEPEEILTSEMAGDEGVFSFANAAGDLLFYSNGTTIWNSDNTVMPNGTGLGGDQSAAQAGIVVPDPADGDLYYIFTAYDNVNTNRYSTLDMTLDSGKGDIVLKNQMLPTDKGITEKVTATRHANGTDYWLVTADDDTAELYVYQITAAGIVTPTTYDLGGTVNSKGGEMDISADGSMLVVGSYFSNRVLLIDFDNATGELSNKRELPVSSPYGVEVSASSRVLYIVPIGTTVYQVDLTQPNTDAMMSTANVFTKSSDGLGLAELGPDGRMYIAQAQTYHTTVDHLDVIENPDTFGNGALYVTSAITFTSPHGSRSGLPNNFPCPTAEQGLSSDTRLAGLEIQPGELAPAFDINTLVYTASVSNVVSSLVVTPTLNDVNGSQIVRVTPAGGGDPITCTGTPISCPLAVGDNLIEVIVTAEDGTATRTYSTLVNRAPSSDASLIGLEISPGVLAPSFVSSTTSYAVSVGNATSSVAVFPTENNEEANSVITVTPPGGGDPITCTGDPISCPLAVGVNVIEVTVTAGDGTIKSYTISVTRAAQSSDATLVNLTLSSGTLEPTFDSATASYVANVGNDVTQLSATPFKSAPGGSISVNGASVASESASPLMTLPIGSHLIVSVVVTAENGITQTYQVTINRSPVTVNQAASTLQGTPITLSLGDGAVSDADGDEWEVTAAANGDHGTVVLNPDGTFVYTPEAGFVGVDSFFVTVTDDYGAESQLLVTVVVVAKAESSQAGVVLLHDNEIGSSHVLTNDVTGGNPLFTMNLDLPAGAYSGTLSASDIFYILYTEILTPTAEVNVPPSGLQFAGNIFTLDAFLNNVNLENYVFGEPFTITLSYDAALLGDLDENSLVLFYWDEDAQSWATDGLTEVGRDALANTVTYRIAHLTQFSWFADADEVGEVMDPTWFPWVPHRVNPGD